MSTLTMSQAKDSSTADNTNPGSNEHEQLTQLKNFQYRSRAYFITFWNDSYPKELPDKAQYLITCEDETEDGKFHGHAFIYYPNQVAASRVKKLFGNDCHFQRIFSNSGCIQYVKGEIGDERKVKHNFIEHGEPPMDSGVKRTVKELAEIEDPSDLDWKQYNTWKNIKKDNEQFKSTHFTLESWKKPVEVYYIQGESGIGKTEKAKEIIKKHIKENEYFNVVKHEGEFWSGTSNDCRIAVYDDFRDSHMAASEFINFIDYNKHNMNIKGGQQINNYELIIITSVQDIKSLYKNMSDEPRKQWLRRVKVIDMYESAAIHKLAKACNMTDAEYKQYITDHRGEPVSA